MSKSYFAILEVTSNASNAEIRSAYRRLAKAYHPDHYHGDSRPFRQIQEAYSVLGHPRKRKDYEQSIEKVRIKRSARPAVYPEPEPLIPEQRPVSMGAISPMRSFERFSPSFDEVFDWLWDNFSDVHHPKSDRVEHLTLEIPLTREQALRGGNATIMVPARSTCPVCRGYGIIGAYECHRCGGEGTISGEIPVAVAFPPGLMEDHAVVIPLDRFGIRNLYFTVLFRPRDL